MPRYIDVVEVIYEGDNMKALPAADIEEVKHGEWEDDTKRCPNCGTKMDGRMEKIKAYRHDLVPSDAAHGIRGYECENGWYVEINDNMPHWDGFATLWYDGKCRTAITGDDYRRLLSKLEFIERR